jgi:hypothetical protein
MGVFSSGPVHYSSRELEGLGANKIHRLRKEIIRHLDSDPGIRKIVRAKTASFYKKLKGAGARRKKTTGKRR